MGGARPSRAIPELLYWLYIIREFNISEISRMTLIPRSTIRVVLVRNGIEPRGASKEKLKYWSGRAVGYSIKPHGYVEITRGPDKGKQVHRVVMEKQIGRKLKRNEHVHHIDGNRTNNDINNLMLLDIRDHVRAHRLIDHVNRRRDINGRFS